VSRIAVRAGRHVVNGAAMTDLERSRSCNETPVCGTQVEPDKAPSKEDFEGRDVLLLLARRDCKHKFAAIEETSPDAES
jgi:YHS domain-containing protein